MLRARKLDMEMSPDTLEAVGINELFVVVGVDSSSTTEQAASGSSGTQQFSLTQERARTILSACTPAPF